MSLSCTDMCAAVLKEHQHGKSRVRLGRTWREGDVHHFVEWTVHTMLESDMAHAFIEGSNTDMTATDTQKNTVLISNPKESCLRAALCLCPFVTGDIIVRSSGWSHADAGHFVSRCTMSRRTAADAALKRSTLSRWPVTLLRHTLRCRTAINTISPDHLVQRVVH